MDATRKKSFFSRDVDLTEGRILPSVLRYSLPIIVSGMLQVFYNAADLIVVGNFDGQNAVAAVGATGSLTHLIVNLFMGMSVGVDVLFARYCGARDRDMIRRTVHTTVLFSILLGLLSMTCMFLFARPLLTATNCPAECYEGAVLYLMIYAVGIPGTMLYNFGTALLRTKGDTQSPFYYLAISGLVNVVLNLVLVIGFSLGVAGVAIATAVSQYLSAALVLGKLCRQEDEDCRLTLSHLCFDFGIAGKILRYGLPNGVQNALFSLANLQIQSAINDFGPAAVAGNSSASQIESFLGTACNGFNAATVAFVGQNVGAHKPERVSRSIRVCLAISVSLRLIGGVGIYLLSEPLLSLFIPGETAAIAYGAARMKYNMLAFVITAYEVLVSASQAFGKTLLTMLNSVFCILVLRVIWMTFVYPHFYGTIDYVFICWPITWAANALMNGIVFFRVYRRYKRGQLKEQL